MRGRDITSYGFGRLRLFILPVLVWLAVAACVVFLFRQRSARFEVVGLAQGRVHEVAATCPGRLRDVPVRQFQPVKAGDVVAVLDRVPDDENLRAQLNTASARIQQLKAQLAAAENQLSVEAANRETDWTASQRRFIVDAENARLRVLEIKTQIATDMITLADLGVEIEIVESLVDKNAVSPYELEKVQVQYNALSKKVQENQNLLKEAANNLIEADKRRDEYLARNLQHPALDTALEVIRQAIKVQENVVAELQAKQEPLILKAPFDGVVVHLHSRPNEILSYRAGENVLRRPGEVVVAGQAILVIAEAKTSEIIAYAGDRMLGQVKEEMAVELVKSSEPARIARSRIVSVGPGLELMPERLWRNPTVPQWGRPVLIGIPAGMELLPGELVGIRGL